MRNEGSTFDRERTIQRYLAGDLSAQEASAFEEEYFADDELATELEQAVEIRAAVRAPARRSIPLFRITIAAAAAVGILAVGLALYLQPLDQVGTDTPVMRTSESALALSVESNDDQLMISWQAVEGADIYRVELFDLSGNIVVRQEVVMPGIQLPRPAIESAQVVRVQALGVLREALVDSGLTSLDDE